MKNNKGLHIAIWIAQGLTSILLFVGAFMKLTMPISELSINLKWTAESPKFMVRALGIIDLIGAVGIILPSLLKVKPKLAPIAALGTILLMVSAIVFHIIRNEASVIGFNFVMIVFATFVYWGRSKKAIILAK